MPIKIHHGPNGSYKTSGAVWDDAVPAAKAGRYIITNIRGMSSERFHALFDDLPDTFELEYINHETREGMERIRTWFQWAPRNAFLIFDEAQTLFPKKWTQKDLDRYAYPSREGLCSLDAANADDRPMDFLDAWTRHRHWNWDVILTTPNIKYVHEEIRNTSEAAYQHSNLMLLGKYLKKLVGKDYKEAMHSAQENKAPTDGSNIVALRKIDKRVFRLYDSTATGQHRDTMAGKNALASPRVLGLGLLVLGICGYLYYSMETRGICIPFCTEVAGASPSSPPVAPQARAAQAVHVPAPGGTGQQAPASAVQPVAPPKQNDPFAPYEITVAGSLWNDEKGFSFLFNVSKDGKSFRYGSKDFFAAGYEIRARGSCAADLIYEGQTRTVACLGSAPGSAPKAAPAGSPGSRPAAPTSADQIRHNQAVAASVPVQPVAEYVNMNYAGVPRQ